jgi:hypothetical protein
MKKILMVAIALIATVSITSCTSSSAKTPKTISKDSASVVKNDKPEVNTWQYENLEDKMGESSKIASVEANEKVNFDFPYNGGSTATLMIRKKGKDNSSVMLTLTKCQFNGTSLDDINVRIKFDNEQPKTYSAGLPSDGSSDLIFIHGGNKLLEKIKSSKKIIIEAEFYNEGNRQIEFNTEGLNW